jgi:hypothetical protein
MSKKQTFRVLETAESLSPHRSTRRAPGASSMVLVLTLHAVSGYSLSREQVYVTGHLVTGRGREESPDGMSGVSSLR